MIHLIQTSGGIGSWGTALRVVQAHGPTDVQFLFADTLIEDGDAYRFLIEGTCSLMGHTPPTDALAIIAGMPEAHEDLEQRKRDLAAVRGIVAATLPYLHWIADGRSPHELFRDKRMLGNSRIDPCSQVLKRELIGKWKRAHLNPADTICYVGIDWSEIHRYERIRDRHSENGWVYKAPLCEPPYIDRDDLLQELDQRGIKRPRLYELGFAHNNCGGGCVKAGHGHWLHLLETMPDRFAWWEAEEEKMRQFLGRDVSMLTDRRGGGKKPMTLTVFRERARQGRVDQFDIGGCACALPESSDD